MFNKMITKLHSDLIFKYQPEFYGKALIYLANNPNMIKKLHPDTRRFLLKIIENSQESKKEKTNELTKKHTQ